MTTKSKRYTAEQISDIADQYEANSLDYTWDARIAAILRQAASDVRDAERFRWLEKECTCAPDEYGVAAQLYFGTYSYAKGLRETIDTAMGERDE